MFNQIYAFTFNNFALLVSLLTAIVALVTAIVGRKKQQVYAIIPNLIGDAQALQSSNNDKFEYVLDFAYRALPKFFRIFISEDDISRAIESTLNKLKYFAKQQAQSTAIKAITTNNLNNTNIQSPADIAAQIKNDTAAIISDTNDIKSDTIVTNPESITS